MIQIPSIAWTQLIHGILWVVISITILIVYRHQINKTYLAIVVATASFGTSSLLIGIGQIINDEILVRISVFFLSLTAFSGILFIDYITNEKLNVWHTSLTCILMVSTFLLMYEPNSIEYVKEQNFIIPIWAGELKLLALIIDTTFLMFAFAYCMESWKKVHLSLPESRYIAIGAVIAGPLSIICQFFQIYLWEILFSIIGCSILAIVGFKNPKLLYLISFKATQLIVIDEKSGLLIFDRSWEKSPMNCYLLSGLLKGLLEITKVSMRQGYIQEIKLDNGFLLLRKTESFFIGIFCTNSSNYLQNCLERFANAFQKQFSKVNSNDSIDLNDYKETTSLIEQYFSYIAPKLITPQQIEKDGKKV